MSLTKSSEYQCGICEEKNYILKRLKDKREKLNRQIEMIEDLKIEAVTEEEWHKLCETPIRHNDILLDIAMATFPEGDYFESHPNEVSFELNGFNISVPTSDIRGVTVDMSWYKTYLLSKDVSFKPKNRYGHMRTYFKLLDDGNYTWYDLAKSRCEIASSHYNKFELFIWWFTKAKWVKVNRNEWSERFKIEDEENTKRYTQYTKAQEEIELKIKEFHKIVDILKEWGEVKGYIPRSGIWSTINIENFLR